MTATEPPTLTNRLKDLRCPLPADRVAPLETFTADKLRRFEEGVAQLVRHAVADSDNFRSAKLDEFLSAMLAGLNARLDAQLSAVMADPAFVRLERNNKSVEELVFQKDGAGVKKRVLNVTPDQLRTALADANGVAEDAAFYAPLVRDEFHQPGGRPNRFVVLVDEVGPEDAPVLRALAGVCREGHAPVLAQVKPHVVCPPAAGSDDPPAGFAALPTKPDDLIAEYRKPENAGLHGVQQSADGTHLALGVGNVIGRPPYHPVKNPAPRAESFAQRGGPLLIPSQVMLAKSLAASLTRYKTAVRLAGVHSGGKHTRPAVVEDGQVRTTEVVIDDKTAMALKKCGFFSFQGWKYRDFVVSFDTPSAYVPVPTGDPARDADAVVASQLPFVMLSCQFGQLLKARLREAVGQTVNEKAIKAMLEAEFARFVTPDVNSVDQPTLARKPLARVGVEVKMVSPGVFTASAQLQPHLLMAGAKVLLTLKAEVSPAKP